MAEDLWGLLEDAAARHADKILLQCGAERRSYVDVLEASRRAAAGLHELGVRPGDRVCLMLGNRPEYVYAWFGLCRLGAVTVPVNVHLKGEGLHYTVEHSGAKLVLAEPELAPRIENHLTVLTELPTSTAPSPRADVDPADPTSILYTSGTTGPPKGVMLSHRAYLNSAHHFATEMVGATADDVLYTTLPLFHINAQAHTVLPAIQLGATFALGARFSASGFWEDVRRQGATIFNSLAAMIPILCKQPPSPRDRDHRARLTASAATPKDVWLEFERRFGVEIVEGYGLTETAGFCVANPRGSARIGSIGKPMSWIDARVEENEILLHPRAEHLFMEGYYRNPDATAEAMRDGWFHSGDAGSADDDGYLYFRDRIKQSIRRRGENISSWEVEKVVNAHPAVLESAAVGHPSELGEEDVRIIVVPRPGQAVEPLEIVRWCETRMAYFMVPRYVEFRDELPKTATERVEKYRLKAEGLGPGAWDREAAGYRVRRD
jgi:crotonobetaine/carnitine-CoA ligase